MSSFHAAICLLSFGSFVLSQVRVKESGPSILKPSETLRMTCKVTGASLTDRSKIWDVHWVRQPTGKGLQWMGLVNGDNWKPCAPSLQSRLTISRDTSKGEVYLEMISSTTEDTAVYYCVGGLGSEGSWSAFDYWGQGTMVTVTSVEKTAPSVFPLIQCSDTMGSTSQMNFGCLVKGYFPEPVSIKWNSGSITDNIKNFPAVLGSQSGLYTRTSLLTIKASDWKSNKFECNIEHTATGTKIDKRIVSDPPQVKQPTVQVLQSSCEDRDGNGSIELVCLINEFSPSDIKVQWLLNGNVQTLSPITSSPTRDSKGMFMSRSQVNIPISQWNDGDTYTCQVHHPASTTAPTDSIRKCTSEAEGLSQPKMILIQPSVKSLYVTYQPKITCNMLSLKHMDNTVVTWVRNDGRTTIGTTTPPQYHYDGTISISSFLTVSTQEWERGDKFTCKLTNADLPTPISKTISKEPDGGSAPVVYMLPPAQQEVRSQETVTITCLIMHFKPKNVYIQWKQRDTVLSEDAYINTEPTYDKIKENYFLYSKLTVQTSDWMDRNVFTCEVIHSAFPNKSMQQSIQKPLGKFRK